MYPNKLGTCSGFVACVHGQLYLLDSVMLKPSVQRACFTILHLIVHSLKQHERAAVICQPLFAMIERATSLSPSELAL